jgi:hypothetical protein
MGHFPLGVMSGQVAGAPPAPAGEFFFDNWDNTDDAAPVNLWNGGGGPNPFYTCPLTSTRAFYSLWDGTDIRIFLLGLSGTTISVIDTYVHTVPTGTAVPSITKMTDTTAMIVYGDANDLDGLAFIVTNNSDTVEVGTEFQWFTGTAVPNTITVTKINTDKAVVTYRDADNSNYPTAQTLDVSGTTITGNTDLVIESTTYSGVQAIMRVGDDKAVVMVRDTTLNNGESWVITDSSGTLSAGSRYQFTDFDAAQISCDASFNGNGKVYVCYHDNDNSAQQSGETVSWLQVGTISGTVITWGTRSPVPFSSGRTATNNNPSFCLLGENYGFLTARDHVSTDYHNIGRAFEIDGTTVTWSTGDDPAIHDSDHTGTDSMAGGPCIFFDQHHVVSLRRVEVVSNTTYEHQFAVHYDGG